MRQRITPGALGFIVIIFILFAAMFISDPSLSAPTLVEFGAKTNFQIADGKIWYLVTPIFLHGSLLHLFFNSMAIYFFAPYVEMYFGLKKFILISLVSGIIATLGSFIFSNSISLGASGVVYGYLAFHIYLFLRNREVYMMSFGRDVFVLIGINVIYSLVAGNIDLAGHLFGFFGGLAMYFLLGRPLPQRFPQRALAILFIALILAGGAYRAITYKNSEDYYLKKLYYYYELQDGQRFFPLEEEFLKKFPQYRSP